MPQPINKIVSNPRIIEDTNALSEKPEIAVIVVRIFALWAGIERRLSVLLVRLLGADAAPALAIFSILQTQALQTKALEAAAKSTLSTDDFYIFSATMTVVNAVQKTRNRLAHWTWAKCLERPDLLLLGDPDSLKERDTRVAAHFQAMDPDKPNQLATYVAVQFDASKFLAYTKADLEREVRDLMEASDIIFLYGIHLDPSFGLASSRLRESRQTADEIRAEALQKLNERRLFREALAQIYATRQSKHQRSDGSNPQSPANLQ